MKTRLLFFAAVTLLALKPCPTFGMSVPVADDSSSSTKSTLTLAANIWPVLYVNEKQTAFVRFNWLDTNVLPATFTPADISSVTLRLFVASAVHPADLTIHAVTTAWSESTVGSAPQVSSSIVATIPAAVVKSGHFVSVDVTQSVILALQNGTDYGFAIQSGTAKSTISIASKEDAAHGYPAELDIEAGVLAGSTETPSFNNTAVGVGALVSSTENGYNNNNTAIGWNVMSANTAGGGNTAVGSGALTSGTNSFSDTAIGVGALGSNTSGFVNTAIGAGALGDNRTGSFNVAIGQIALQNNSTGYYNIAIGYEAGGNVQSGSNDIEIGTSGVFDESNVIHLGDPNKQTAAYIAGISGVTVSGGAPVYALSNGQLGTLNSSRRFKTDIAPMGDASKALLALHPVTFRYKPQYDSKGIPQYGLIAEDVAKVCPNLVIRDAKGQIQTVRYEEVNAMLLNEFLKEHQQVEEQGKTIAEYQKRLSVQEDQTKVLASRLEALTRGMERISQRIEGDAGQSATKSAKGAGHTAQDESDSGEGVRMVGYTLH